MGLNPASLYTSYIPSETQQTQFRSRSLDPKAGMGLGPWVGLDLNALAFGVWGREPKVQGFGYHSGLRVYVGMNCFKVAYQV